MLFRLLFLAVAVLSSLHASEVERGSSNPLWRWLVRLFSREDKKAPELKPAHSSKPMIHPVLEVKGGYFIFSSAKMRRVYDRGGVDLQLSGSFPVAKWLEVYSSIEYLTRHGRSLGGNEKTRIWQVPLSLGLKPMIRISPKAYYYFSLGPRYFFTHVHNSTPYLDRKINTHGLGGFANMGFNFFPSRHFLIDIFSEYSYLRTHFHPHKNHVHGRGIQIGGFTFGGGLGYAF